MLPKLAGVVSSFGTGESRLAISNMFNCPCEQWIEYDVHGQYFGWGETPSIMAADLERRLAYGTQNNVTGFIMRTDWEGVQDTSCFDTPNLINLYAAAMLAKNPATERRDIYARWIEGEQFTADGISPAALKATIDWTVEVMEQTWPLVCGTVFVNGTVFSDNSAFHVNIKQPTWVAETHQSLKNWFSGAEDALGMQDANAMKILAEKDEAMQNARELYDGVTESNPGFQPAVTSTSPIRSGGTCRRLKSPSSTPTTPQSLATRRHTSL